jgi:hypothetical protein
MQPWFKVMIARKKRRWIVVHEPITIVGMVLGEPPIATHFSYYRWRWLAWFECHLPDPPIFAMLGMYERRRLLGRITLRD